MSIRSARIDGVRNLLGQVLEPGAGPNFFAGPNGAGKTSVLEAIHLLALGRSFRSGSRRACINRDTGMARIVVDTGRHRLGVEYRADGWEARVDGSDCTDRARLSRALPLLVFHPESHALVDGEPLHRRRMMDQGVFHVEPAFLSDWRSYRRALQQRNAALRAGVPDAVLEPWEREMAAAAERITACRERYVAMLDGALRAVLEALAVRLPRLELRFRRGWAQEGGLAPVLAGSRASDRERGYTQHGPQRADVAIRDEDGAVAGRYSRGQQKLVALGLLLAQARLLGAGDAGDPVVLFDDMASELDRDHQGRVGRYLAQSGWQLWITGVEPPEWLDHSAGFRLFHVEQGRVRAASA